MSDISTEDLVVSKIDAILDLMLPKVWPFKTPCCSLFTVPCPSSLPHSLARPTPIDPQDPAHTLTSSPAFPNSLGVAFKNI